MHLPPLMPKNRKLFVGSIKQNVAIYTNVEFVADGDFDRWLDVQISPCDLCTELTDLLADSASCNFPGTRVLKDVGSVRLRELKARTEETRQGSEANQSP